MASGMEFMLKQLGIDPKEILQSVNGFKSAFLDIATKLGNIEAQNNVILANQKSLCEKMEVPFHGFQPDNQAANSPGHARAITGSSPGSNGAGKT
jgi:hypothetical protein